MTQVRITEIPVPREPGPAPATVHGWVDVSRETLLEVLGNDDFVDPPDSALAAYADQKHTAKTVLVALAGDRGEVLGYARIDLPLDDNRHLAMVELAVRPAHRRQGIGSALWSAALTRIRSAGRTVVTAWSSHRREVPATAPGALLAPTGAGVISRYDAPAAFALAHGFTLEQTDRHSTLALPVGPERLTAWRAQAQTVAGGEYRLVQWVDRTPQRWVDALAELQRRMSVDAPVAGLDLHEEVWDADRVRDADATAARTGNRYVLSAAEHVPSGTLVAFTQIEMPQDRPAVVFQENTLVHGEHRGRRLGLLVKAANLELLARVQPQARRVHTWNAGENRHMLAINVQMGFRRASTEGTWQRRLQ